MLRFEQGVIGHRGACKQAPENTLASFKKAHELGIQWVEFDVMLSKDNIPIIFHDETLDRTTNGQGYIDAFTYTELSQFDAGSWFDPQFAGEHIPLLQDVIIYLTENNISANIEIKPLHHNEEKNVEQALEVIKKIKSPDDPLFLFSSFSIEALKHLQTLAPHTQRGLLLDEWREDCLAIAKTLGCVSINLNQDIITPKRAAEIKTAGFNLLCFTVNDAPRAAELRSWGVDAVFSDTPDVSRCSGLVRRVYCRMS